jgi:spermidine synthase
MVYLAALCSGLGGLLIELVLLRRFGLLLGNTSGAADLVIGSFLLGLGVGGLLVPRLIGRLARPILAASAIYVAVALACALLDLLLERIPPLSFAAGIALLPLVPGIPTLLMGMAFPLIFFVFGDRRIRWRVGLLVAANLAGSLLATAFGGNLAIPEYGLRATALAGSGAYLAAAALLVRPGLRTRVPLAAGRRSAAGLPPLGRLAVFAALSGALVTGIQVFLLRRLTFFLEGWQPTISGVLAACLLGLTLGSGLGTGLFARWLRDRAPVTCLLLGALAANLGLQEHLVLRMSLLPMDSDLQLHAIIWLCAIVCAGLPCFFLGAVVPLCVARFDDPALRSALAGRLFFWQGVGSIVGTLGVGQIFPLLAPRTYYTVAPLLMGLATVALVVRALPPVVAAGCAALLLALATLGVSGAGSLLDPEAPLERPHRRYTNDYRYVDHRTDGTVTASVVWDRERYSMILFTNEFLATDTGPLASYMKVLGHLPFLLREDPQDVAVIAFGTGTTARSVTVWPVPGSVNLVEIAGAVIEMAPHFTGLGPRDDPPVPAFLEDPRTRVWLTDGRRFLARAPPRSLDMISMEPLLPYAPGTVSLYTREFYELAGRALSPTGLLVQWVPTQALPAAYYDSLLPPAGAGGARRTARAGSRGRTRRTARGPHHLVGGSADGLRRRRPARRHGRCADPPRRPTLHRACRDLEVRHPAPPAVPAERAEARRSRGARRQRALVRPGDPRGPRPSRSRDDLAAGVGGAAPSPGRFAQGAAVAGEGPAHPAGQRAPVRRGDPGAPLVQRAARHDSRRPERPGSRPRASGARPRLAAAPRGAGAPRPARGGAAAAGGGRGASRRGVPPVLPEPAALPRWPLGGRAGTEPARGARRAARGQRARRCRQR